MRQGNVDRLTGTCDDRSTGDSGLWVNRNIDLRPSVDDELPLVGKGISVAIVTNRDDQVRARDQLSLTNLASGKLRSVIRHRRQGATGILVCGVLVDQHHICEVIVAV